MATTTGSGMTNTSGAFVYQWTSVPNGNQGNWVDVSAAGDISVQVEGTFGVGGSVTIEGSLDSTHAEALSDRTGAPLTLTAAGIKSVLQLPKLIRPNVTAGDGTTSLTITIVARPID